MDEKKAILAVDLTNVKVFNDQYGFARDDEVIRFTADILKGALDDCHGNDDFLGHTGGDNFIIIIPCRYSRQLSETIIKTFEQGYISVLQ